VGCSSPLLEPTARRWINHLSLWRMASATPDLRLPSQSQNIAAPQLVPNYTAQWQRHMRVNNLPEVVAWQRNGRKLNSRYTEEKLAATLRGSWPGCNPHRSLWHHNSETIRDREKRRRPCPIKSSGLSNGENRIALRQLLQNRKLRNLWRHNLGSRWKL